MSVVILSRIDVDCAVDSRDGLDAVLKLWGGRSHSEEEIREAYFGGDDLYLLDSGNGGDDDVLIGDYDDVYGEVCAYYEDDIADGFVTVEKTWDTRISI